MNRTLGTGDSHSFTVRQPAETYLRVAATWQNNVAATREPPGADGMISAIRRATKLQGLEPMGIDPEFPELIFQRLPGNAQLDRGTRRTRNHTLRFADHAFYRCSFTLGKGHD